MKNNPYERALALARIAAYRHMRLAGRNEWDTSDWEVYLAEYDQLYPLARAEALRDQAEKALEGP